MWVAYHPSLTRFRRLNTGDYSYGTYLYGFPIQQSIMLWLAPKGYMGVAQLAALGSIASLGAGVVSWYGIERWFIAMKSRTAPSPRIPLPNPSTCSPADSGSS
jgi:peptidoglycan/LPS O-acetylase OafA/YrhL